MATNPNTTGLRFMRLCDTHGYMGHAMSARAGKARRVGAYTLFAPITGLAQGRIVSISRGSPPSKKR